MKTLLTTALLMITSFGAFSQDTLITRNGQIIPAKVFEITQTDIKYKKPSNPDGPLYTISKENIAVIEYKNGSKDVFPYEGQSQTAQPSQATDNTYSNNAAPQVSNNYYGNQNPRPNINVVLGMGGGYGGFGMPYYGMGWGGFGGWGGSYYGGGWGGYHGGWGGYHHGGWGGHYHHRR